MPLGVAYFGLVLSGLMRGVTREEVLDARSAPLVRLREIFPLHAEVDEVAGGSFRRREPPEIVGSSYVVNSWRRPCGLSGGRQFRHAVLRPSDLGDDADTISALCGQLAALGPIRWPQPSRASLARGELVDRTWRGCWKAAAISRSPQPAAKPQAISRDFLVRSA